MNILKIILDWTHILDAILHVFHVQFVPLFLLQHSLPARDIYVQIFALV